MTTQPMTQGEAVFQAIKTALKGEIKDGAKVVLTDEQRAQVCATLTKGFQEKRIVLKDTPANQDKLKDAKLLKSYVSGLLNNWLKKDKRLNGKGMPKDKVVPAPVAKVPASSSPVKEESKVQAAIASKK